MLLGKFTSSSSQRSFHALSAITPTVYSDCGCPTLQTPQDTQYERRSGSSRNSTAAFPLQNGHGESSIVAFPMSSCCSRRHVRMFGLELRSSVTRYISAHVLTGKQKGCPDRRRNGSALNPAGRRGAMSAQVTGGLLYQAATLFAIRSAGRVSH
jgi:hypothetical protein